MEYDSENVPSIIYTSDDSAENAQSDDSGDIGQSDDSTDVIQSDDSGEVGQSDDSGEVGVSHTAYLDSDGTAYIAQNVRRASMDDDACELLLEGDGGTVSPAITSSYHHPLTGPNYTPHKQHIQTVIADVCGVMADLSDTASQLTGASNQQLYNADSSSGGVGSRSPSPSETSQQEEALGLLSLHHQYQPLCPQPMQTTVHYAHLAQDHSVTTKLRCDPLDPLNMLVAGKKPTDALRSKSHHERWLVADIHIDARYKDAFYVQWNWRKIRNACALLNLGILLSLLVVGVALLVQMPQGHECDPSREWWQGHVSYHVLVPSFKDSTGDGVGDLQGVVHKLDYIQDLGVSMVRLAPLFERGDTLPPERVLVPHEEGPKKGTADVAWNLTRVSPVLGTGGEVQLLAALLHERGMKLLLDLPLAPGIPTQEVTVPGVSSPVTPSVPATVVVAAALAEATRAMRHWLRLGVDGFVMPDLQQLVTVHNAHQVLDGVEAWRLLLDRSPRVGVQQRVLVLPASLVRDLQHYDNESGVEWDMAGDNLNSDYDEEVFTLSERALRAAHLLEEHLHLGASPTTVMEQIENTLQLSATPSSPWILWSMTGIGRPRISQMAPPHMRLSQLPYHLTDQETVDSGLASVSSRLQHNGGAFPATDGGAGIAETAQTQAHVRPNVDAGFWSSVGRNLLLLFLPGSTSLYYGDEIDVAGPTDMKDLSWAGIMAWGSDSQGSFSRTNPWLPLDNHYEWHNVQHRRNTSVQATASMVQHKQDQPPLFINGLFNYKGDFHPTKASNYKVRYLDDNLLILDRFYPRRRQYTVVANLGSTRLQRDLSHYYYGGSVVASSHHKHGYVKFRSLSMQPSEVLVCVLDK